MRVFLTVVAAVVVVIVLAGLVPFRNDEAAAEALDACSTQTEGMPLTANEKEIFVYRCMSSWHFSYLTKCGDSHATQCYLRIPTKSAGYSDTNGGHLFRSEAGHHSDLMAAG